MFGSTSSRLSRLFEQKEQVCSFLDASLGTPGSFALDPNGESTRVGHNRLKSIDVCHEKMVVQREAQYRPRFSTSSLSTLRASTNLPRRTNLVVRTKQLQTTRGVAAQSIQPGAQRSLSSPPRLCSSSDGSRCDPKTVRRRRVQVGCPIPLSRLGGRLRLKLSRKPRWTPPTPPPRRPGISAEAQSSNPLLVGP